MGEREGERESRDRLGFGKEERVVRDNQKKRNLVVEGGWRTVLGEGRVCKEVYASI